MLLIHNIRFAGETEPDGWILVDGDTITDIGHDELPKVEADQVHDGAGALALPGAIDCHVHMREPGMTAKGDIASETQAARVGGVTSVIDMPNCRPATTTTEAWQWKMDRAAVKAAVNYAFFIGATNDNLPQLTAADYSRVPGVKLFMGSSTGNMLVDDADTISQIFSSVPAIVAVHAEDQDIIAANTRRALEIYPAGSVPVAEHSAIRSAEACVAATQRAVDLALEHHHRLHICHLSTAREIEIIRQANARAGCRLVTCEVSPHHLLFCSDDYRRLGTRIKMNPSVKTAADRDALRRALVAGDIDMVATDHAPHLLSEKDGDALTAVSGAPMVQFSLPVMLSIFDETTVQRVMCQTPAAVYGIKGRGHLLPGYRADIVLVAETAPHTVTDTDVHSRCGWTPLAGTVVRHRVSRVWVNGGQGPRPLEFDTELTKES